jgi:hypothetical protein
MGRGGDSQWICRADLLTLTTVVASSLGKLSQNLWESAHWNSVNRAILVKSAPFQSSSAGMTVALTASGGPLEND